MVQRRVSKILEDRQKMGAGALAINWGLCRDHGVPTLLFEGHPVRISGQDVGRGTFSHRHAALHNQKDGSTYIPLQQHLYEASRVSICTTPSFPRKRFSHVRIRLRHYHAERPGGVGSAVRRLRQRRQVVIDQFITSGEHKWGRLCGLTMLLPHGYEGQGPEHSSARLERYLQLCAGTTSRSAYRPRRRRSTTCCVVRRFARCKPLVTLTPKSLLRHKLATSTLEELTQGSLQTVIPEIDPIDPAKVERVIVCSGKVYYDLLDKRRAEGRDDIAIVRIEQLYPFPEEDLAEALAPYQKSSTSSGVRKSR